MKIFNAFSINMLPGDCTVVFETIPVSEIPDNLESFIGHQDTANVISNLLDIKLPMNRQSVTLNTGEICIVAQYTGSRLPEGATILPEGSNIVFWQVFVKWNT